MTDSPPADKYASYTKAIGVSTHSDRSHPVRSPQSASPAAQKDIPSSPVSARRTPNLPNGRSNGTGSSKDHDVQNESEAETDILSDAEQNKARGSKANIKDERSDADDVVQLGSTAGSVTSAEIHDHNRERSPSERRAIKVNGVEPTTAGRESGKTQNRGNNAGTHSPTPGSDFRPTPEP
ncbi:hypothetical protein LTS18_009308, partial [Coniosporium uncinatum]